MKQICWKDSGAQEALEKLYQRPAAPPEIELRAADIVKAVRERGNAAIQEFLEKFDQVSLTPDSFLVGPNEYAEAEAFAGEEVRKAVAEAIANITVFAESGRPLPRSFSPRAGVQLGEVFHPMDRVGCYIPGGTAPLVSTVIHTVALAKAAGVKEIVAVTPPMKNGKVNPSTLYALKTAGATEVYKMGGAYAIAALAYGTETIRKVEKIVGPGNAYVAAAKKLVYGTCAIDMVAGPSEIMIIADRYADPAFAAADMLSQAEHGSGLEQAVLVSNSPEFLSSVMAAVEWQAALLTRSETIHKVMENGMFFIECRDLDHAAEIASCYAPEHLEIMVESPRKVLPKIRAAGAIFLGKWSPEPAGDFTAGPSHVLPTAGTARFFHGLTTMDFMRRSSVIEYSPEALASEVPSIRKFAEMEGLDAHGRSVSIRIEKE